MADFEAILEEMRQALTINACAIELNDGKFGDEPDEPVEKRYIRDTVRNLEKLRAEGAPEGLEHVVLPCAEYLDEHGNEYMADWRHVVDSPDVLQRVAARSIVAYSILRAEAERHLATAWTALDMIDRPDGWVTGGD